MLLGLLWFYLEDGEQLGAVLVYVSIVGSTMVSYVRARAEGLGIECKGGLMQRPERVASLGIGIIVGQWWPAGSADRAGGDRGADGGYDGAACG